MSWEVALEIVVARTRHERFHELCDESWPDHEDYRALVIRLAAGAPVGTGRESPAVPIALGGCCPRPAPI